MPGRPGGSGMRRQPAAARPAEVRPALGGLAPISCRVQPGSSTRIPDAVRVAERAGTTRPGSTRRMSGNGALGEAEVCEAVCALRPARIPRSRCGGGLLSFMVYFAPLALGCFGAGGSVVPFSPCSWPRTSGWPGLRMMTAGSGGPFRRASGQTRKATSCRRPRPCGQLGDDHASRWGRARPVRWRVGELLPAPADLPARVAEPGQEPTSGGRRAQCSRSIPDRCSRDGG